MTLTLLADAALRPYLEQLLSLCPNRTHIFYLSGTPVQRQYQIARQLTLADGCDAVVLLDGTDLIPECGWTAGNVPLVIPRVHNVAALLLGGQEAYRRLFGRYDGGLCWAIPGRSREICTTPREDCHLLCLLADAQLSLPDASLYARMIARYNNWDFIQVPTDLSLLESLLCGGWNCEDFLIVQPGQLLLPLEETGFAYTG